MEPMFVKKFIDNTAFLQQLFNKLKPTIEAVSREKIFDVFSAIVKARACT